MDNQDNLNILSIGNIIKKYLKLFIFCALLSSIFVYLITEYIITPKYTANATMVIGSSGNTEGSNLVDELNIDYNQIQANKALISTYSEIVKSRGIADKVISNLNLDMDYEEFSEKVSIEPVNDTQIISVKVVDTIPERTQDIANETANIFKDSIGDIMKVDNVQILDGASLPDTPYSPNILINTIAGFLAGNIIGIIIAIFREFSDTTIKSQDDINKYFDIPVIGIIPDKKQG